MAKWTTLNPSLVPSTVHCLCYFVQCYPIITYLTLAKFYVGHPQHVHFAICDDDFHGFPRGVQTHVGNSNPGESPRVFVNGQALRRVACHRECDSISIRILYLDCHQTRVGLSKLDFQCDIVVEYGWTVILCVRNTTVMTINCKIVSHINTWVVNVCLTKYTTIPCSLYM